MIVTSDCEEVHGWIARAGVWSCDREFWRFGGPKQAMAADELRRWSGLGYGTRNLIRAAGDGSMELFFLDKMMVHGKQRQLQAV